nr:uncharacterized protein LOC127347623 [Lolium perenne]
MGKGKRVGNKGKHRGDGVPPPAGAGDQGKQAHKVAVLRAVNARIIAELVETRALLAKHPDDGVRDDDVVLPGDAEEAPLHGATKDAAVQEKKDLEKDAVAEEADVSALPVLSEVSDAVSAVVDGEESEEESSEEEKLKSDEPMTLLCDQSLENLGKEAADDGVVAREVHVAATDSQLEDAAALRARLAAAEAKAARLEAANAEKLQALERLGAKEAEAKAASERVAELEREPFDPGAGTGRDDQHRTGTACRSERSSREAEEEKGSSGSRSRTPRGGDGETCRDCSGGCAAGAPWREGGGPEPGWT